MSHDTERTHPDETALIAWLDEPTRVDDDVARHVERCETCAATVRDLRAVLAGLAAEPAMPDAETLAASRERIHESIAGDVGPAVRSLPAWRPVAWASILAAAALAGLLLWSPRGEESPASRSDLVTRVPPAARVDAESLVNAVNAQAERAAEEVVAAALPASGAGDDPGEALLDEEAVESLAEIESTTPSLVDESAYESTELAERFAALSEEDQAAILDELSELTFEL